MALEPSKLIVFGPFSLSFKLVAAQTVAYAGLKPDSLTLSVETKKGNAVFEDGTEEDWDEGRKLTAELVISELSTTDLAAIETSDNFVLTMDNGSILTVASPCRFFTDVDNGKTKVTIFKTVATGVAMSSMFAIS
jgi:hypothetical protein